MKRYIRKAVSFLGVLALMTALACPNVVAGSESAFKSSVILESNYDQAVMWNNGALFIKNCSVENTYQIAVTDQSDMVLVKQDGTTSDFMNTQKFDKIVRCAGFLIRVSRRHPVT